MQQVFTLTMRINSKMNLSKWALTFHVVHFYWQ